MAGSPQFKVFDGAGTYQAACKEPAAAALLTSMYGPGSTVRNGHAKRDTVWTQGPDADGDVADIGYDDIEALMYYRIARRVPAEALRTTISTLSAQANAALASGDTDTYHQRVDEMIEVQDRYIDKHGNLPGRQL